MPYIKVYIHFVWSTKNREPYFATKELRQIVWNHIKENAVKKNIHIDYVSGHKDHCHCLVSLAVDQNIQKVMQLIKGESSFWINRNEKIKPLLKGRKFEWQDAYFAVSVSESMIDRVRDYIKNQEEHHKKKTYQEEFDEFIEKYVFERFNV